MAMASNTCILHTPLPVWQQADSNQDLFHAKPLTESNPIRWTLPRVF